MRVLAAIPLVLLPLASAAGAPSAPQARFDSFGGEVGAVEPDRCDPMRNVRWADTPGRVGVQRLIDLPPGDLDLAVMRSMNNCPEPVTIRQGYGAIEGSRAAKQPRTPAPPRARLLNR